MLYRVTWIDKDGRSQSYGDVPKEFAQEYKSKIESEPDNRNIKLFQVGVTGQIIKEEVNNNDNNKALLVIIGTIIIGIIASISFITAICIIGVLILILAISYVIKIFSR